MLNSQSITSILTALALGACSAEIFLPPITLNGDPELLDSIQSTNLENYGGTWVAEMGDGQLVEWQIDEQGYYWLLRDKSGEPQFGDYGSIQHDPDKMQLSSARTNCLRQGNQSSYSPGFQRQGEQLSLNGSGKTPLMLNRMEGLSRLEQIPCPAYVPDLSLPWQ